MLAALTGAPASDAGSAGRRAERRAAVPKRARLVQFPDIAIERAQGAVHRQVYQALRHAIVAGRITAGTRLPSTRALARRLTLSRNSVLYAYEQLVSGGYVVSRTGSGTRVARAVPSTYLREVLAGALPGRGVSLRRLVRDAAYPVALAAFADPSGNSLFLFDCGDEVAL